MKSKNKSTQKKPRKAINRDGQNNRMAKLNAKAKAQGWSGISEYLTAVLKDEVTIPHNNA